MANEEQLSIFLLGVGLRLRRPTGGPQVSHPYSSLQHSKGKPIVRCTDCGVKYIIHDRTDHGSYFCHAARTTTEPVRAAGV